MTRKPSCLISCSQRGPDGGRGAIMGRHGGMKPAGNVRSRRRVAVGPGVECRPVMIRDNSLERGRHGRIGLRFDVRMLPDFPPKMNTIGCLDAKLIVCLMGLRSTNKKA